MKKLLLVVLLLASCARAPLEDPLKAFRLTEAPELSDSLSPASLKEALERDIAALKKGVNIPPAYIFDGRTVSREDYLLALEALKPETENLDRFRDFVKAHFDFYEVYGNDDGWGVIFSTGYYDPLMQGSRHKTERFSRAIYRTPKDLVTIDLGAYAEKFPDIEPLQKIKEEQKSAKPSWRGRYIAESRRVVPYYSREELESQKVFQGKHIELAWLDPIDAFFLEIQGSGIVDFGRGKRMRVGYDAQNGYPYEPIGKFLTDAIPIEEMSMQRIRQYMNGLSPEAQDQIFFKNPSYVFFKKLEGKSLTYSGAEVTPGRTIATDRFLFPKGTLGFFDIEEPVFANAEALDPSGWERKPRWVFDQDTGGAIRGGGRVDLYYGEGPEAERRAGVMKRSGRLWIAAPKAEFLAELRAANPAK